MIVRILVIVAICIAVILFGYWLFTGGLSRALGFASGIDNPLGYFNGGPSGDLFRLPGQPDSFFPTIDITQDPYYSGTGAPGTGAEARAELNDLQDRYDELYAQAKKAKDFGNPSPYSGKISITSNTAQESSPIAEYIMLLANYQNTAPISLAGWSLQSVVTGIRAPLPPAASTFISGVLNVVEIVTLYPGATVVVMSGPSPVGVSFQTNRCTGYLAELQNFVPELERTCPTAGEEVPLTAENIQFLGDTCIDYAQTISLCHFPGAEIPQNVAPGCANYLRNKLSYNGCMNAHRSERGFYLGSWRLYLASRASLWRDTHDVIRLLDDQGRTVDILTY